MSRRARELCCALLALALSAALCACEAAQATGVLVIVDSDIAVPSALRSIRIRLFDRSGNPWDDVTVEMFRTLRSGGVNRVSIGVQSMSAHVLASLGRTHDPSNVERAVSAVHESQMPTFNLDVIYGAAGESIDDWTSTVERVVALDPPHVSAYGLTVEAGTALALEPARHPDDDDQADKYEIVDDLLGAAGLANYEVSNWARPGHESRHNFLYWRQDDYRGFGSRRIPTRTVVVGGTCGRPTATSTWWVEGAPQNRPRRCSTTRHAASRACS